MTTFPTDGLLAVTVSALQRAGRQVQADWDVETLDVAPADPSGHLIAGVILHSDPGVVFYAVWDDFVPEAAHAAVAQFATGVNTALSTSAVEFNASNGILSVRAGVDVRGISICSDEPDDDDLRRAGALSISTFGRLLAAALNEVETVFGHAQGPADDLIAGRTDAAAAARAVTDAVQD